MSDSNMVYIIIPNYNGKAHLDCCLNSLIQQTYTDYKVIVVDNGSKDDSISFIKEFFPDIMIIELKSNLGFAKAVNIGINAALQNNSTEYILLLNNDIECDKNFIQELVNGFQQPNTGSVSSKMLNYYNRNILDDTGDFVTKKGLPFPRGQGEKDTGQYDKPEFIFSSCAGASMYKKEVFEKVGLLDEDFFAYYEDVDLSFRMQLSGFKCYYNPKAVCYHKRGGTMSSFSNFHIYLIERNIVALRIKNFPLLILIKYSIYFQISRIYRFSRYFFINSPSYFFSAFKGYLNGLLMLPKLLSKRKKIFNFKTVDNKYLNGILK